MKLLRVISDMTRPGLQVQLFHREDLENPYIGLLYFDEHLQTELGLLSSDVETLMHGVEYLFDVYRRSTEARMNADQILAALRASAASTGGMKL